ncbi:hypothetical protein WJX72_000042 [[Myrmecia] bisecta]|uniref:Fe2OG dioxygenase domain-containing protein n=1 Tax=[Myrmecia] bisecta TaxID=41462 RepID=A0AAW1P0H2_9CHLO
MELPSDCQYIEAFLDATAAERYLREVVTAIDYVKPRLQYSIFGKVVSLPRDKAFRADFEKDGSHPVYRYNGKQPPYPKYLPMEPVLLDLRDKVTAATGQRCNSCVVNFYQKGKDKIGYHHDKVWDFEEGSSVCTVSLGECRRFRLKRVGASASIGLDLSPGSLFVLGWDTNQAYRHAIMPTSQDVAPRVSLTYRHIATRNTDL